MIAATCEAYGDNPRHYMVRSLAWNRNAPIHIDSGLGAEIVPEQQSLPNPKNHCSPKSSIPELRVIKSASRSLFDAQTLTGLIVHELLTHHGSTHVVPDAEAEVSTPGAFNPGNQSVTDAVYAVCNALFCLLIP